MTQPTLTQPTFTPHSGSTLLLEETKILFNHRGSDSELVRQIAIAVQAINALSTTTPSA
jgi:hypothetical protein